MLAQKISFDNNKIFRKRDVFQIFNESRITFSNVSFSTNESESYAKNIEIVIFSTSLLWKK